MAAAWQRSIGNEWLKQTRFLFKDVLLHKSVFTCLLKSLLIIIIII